MDAKKQDSYFMDIKRAMLRNPSRLLTISRSSEGYALLKVALQTDKCISTLRFLAKPTDKTRWEQISQAISRLQEILNEYQGITNSMKQYRGSVLITPHPIDDGEAVTKSIYGFVLVPRSPEGGKLYNLIIGMDDILYAYRTMHTRLEAIAEASLMAVDALRILQEYTKQIAAIAAQDYTTPVAVRRLLGEYAGPERNQAGKRKKKERDAVATEPHENIEIVAQAG